MQKALWWEHRQGDQQKITKTTENRVRGHKQTAVVVFHLEHGPHKARKLPGEKTILTPHSSHGTGATTLVPEPSPAHRCAFVLEGPLESRFRSVRAPAPG